MKTYENLKKIAILTQNMNNIHKYDPKRPCNVRATSVHVRATSLQRPCNVRATSVQPPNWPHLDPFLVLFDVL